MSRLSESRSLDLVNKDALVQIEEMLSEGFIEEIHRESLKPTDVCVGIEVNHTSDVTHILTKKGKEYFETLFIEEIHMFAGDFICKDCWDDFLSKFKSLKPDFIDIRISPLKISKFKECGRCLGLIHQKVKSIGYFEVIPSK